MNRQASGCDGNLKMLRDALRGGGSRVTMKGQALTCGIFGMNMNSVASGADLHDKHHRQDRYRYYQEHK